MASYRARYVLTADPRLGRHVNHDPRSRRFPVRGAEQLPIVTTRHRRFVPIFDQGELGSCTGNAALGCMGTGLFYDTVQARADFPFTEDGAVTVYSRASALDNYAGQYPPTDTGSDGLSVAKVLKDAGWISGYEHAFGIDDLIRGLMRSPAIVGTEWTAGMSEPNESGVIWPSGAVQGGHEYVADAYIAAGDPFGPEAKPAGQPMIGFTNSWGESWAAGGHHFMSARDFGKLLDREGDATFFIPLDVAAPEPELPPGADEDDVKIAGVLHAWLDERGL